MFIYLFIDIAALLQKLKYNSLSSLYFIWS